MPLTIAQNQGKVNPRTESIIGRSDLGRLQLRNPDKQTIDPIPGIAADTPKDYGSRSAQTCLP